MMTIIQGMPISWTDFASAPLLNPTAGYTVLAAAKPGVYYQVLAFRMAIAQNTIAAAASAYDVGLVAYQPVLAVVSALIDNPVYVPAAALVGAGPLFDTGLMRFDPVGLGSAALSGYGLYFYTPVALTGLVTVQLGFTALTTT